jgi:hypothetical protein
MTPDLLAKVMEATWPPASQSRLGPFTLRAGEGGGKRVSAASLDGAFSLAELDAVEAAMAEPLMLIREGDTALDAELDRRGWRVVDPVVAYAAPVETLTADLPPLAALGNRPLLVGRGRDRPRPDRGDGPDGRTEGRAPGPD